MKKKLLLIALPALMVLSGCANIQKEQPKVEEQPAVEEFLEDTTACPELFGEAVEAKQPAIRKMAVLDSETDYKVGYQLHYDTGYLSIRFIAALADSGSYSSKVWTRGLALNNGNEKIALSNKRSDTTTLASTVIYSSLFNGEGIDEMRAGQGDYSTYDGFIVYSIRNIPYDDYKDSYFVAYLTLDGTSTDAYAIKIETNGEHTASTHAFKFPSNTNRHFLQGIIEGSVSEIVYPDDNPEDRIDSDGNYASYTGLELKTGDYFGSFFFGTREGDLNPSFRYYGYESNKYDYSTGFLNESNVVSGYATPYVAGQTYNLFVTKANEIWTAYNGDYTGSYPIYLKPGVWAGDSARFAVYAFHSSDGNSINHWYHMTSPKSGVYMLETDEAPLSTYDTIIFVRLNPAGDYNWSSKWNQTGNISLSQYISKGSYAVCEITGWGESDSPHSLAKGYSRF